MQPQSWLHEHKKAEAPFGASAYIFEESSYLKLAQQLTQIKESSANRQTRKEVTQVLTPERDLVTNRESVLDLVEAEDINIKLRTFPEEDTSENDHKSDKTIADRSVLDIEIDFANQVDIDQRQEYPVGIFHDPEDTENALIRSRVD